MSYSNAKKERIRHLKAKGLVDIGPTETAILTMDEFLSLAKGLPAKLAPLTQGFSKKQIEDYGNEQMAEVIEQFADPTITWIEKPFVTSTASGFPVFLEVCRNEQIKGERLAWHRDNIKVIDASGHDISDVAAEFDFPGRGNVKLTDVEIVEVAGELNILGLKGGK